MLSSLTILADISAQDVGQLILTLSAGGAIGCGGMALGKKFCVKVDPQPLEIHTVEKFATREELDRLRDNTNKDIGKLSGQMGELKADSAESKGYLKGIADNQKQILNLLLNRK